MAALLDEIEPTGSSTLKLKDPMICNICMEERDTISLCGNAKCTSQVCEACAMTIWSKVKPGVLLTQADFLCGFCKQLPITSMNTRINEALELFEPGVFCAVCTRCNKIKFHSQEGCNIQTNTNLTKFTCEDCLTSDLVKKCPNCKMVTIKRHVITHCSTCGEYWCFKCGEFHAEDEAAVKVHEKECIVGQIKACPGCETMTNRTYGCDNMTCGLCRIHWCWLCGEFKSNDTVAVYNHNLSCKGTDTTPPPPINNIVRANNRPIRRTDAQLTKTIKNQCYGSIFILIVIILYLIWMIAVYKNKEHRSVCNVLTVSHDTANCCVPDECDNIKWCQIQCIPTECCTRDDGFSHYKYQMCTSKCTLCNQTTYLIEGTYIEHHLPYSFSSEIRCTDDKCNEIWGQCDSCTCYYDEHQKIVEQSDPFIIIEYLTPIGFTLGLVGICILQCIMYFLCCERYVYRHEARQNAL